jgi:hypothetical protein
VGGFRSCWGGVLGVIAGAGGMLIAFPFIFPPPVVSERPPTGTATSQIGAFRFDEEAPGHDLVHWAIGSGGLYRVDRMTVIRFGEDFRGGLAPTIGSISTPCLSATPALLSLTPAGSRSPS